MLSWELCSVRTILHFPHDGHQPRHALSVLQLPAGPPHHPGGLGPGPRLYRSSCSLAIQRAKTCAKFYPIHFATNPCANQSQWQVWKNLEIYVATTTFCHHQLESRRYGQGNICRIWSTQASVTLDIQDWDLQLHTEFRGKRARPKIPWSGCRGYLKKLPFWCEFPTLY